MTNYCAAAVQFVLSVIEASFQEGVEREKIPLSDHVNMLVPFSRKKNKNKNCFFNEILCAVCTFAQYTILHFILS